MIDRRIILKRAINAPVSEVWRAWTTEDGCKTFFAPDCRVKLIHDGWGEGGEWETAFTYFENARSGVVLPGLTYRFNNSSVDWSTPNAFREKT